MQDRSVEFPGRRKMIDVVTGDEYIFDVEPAEGEIFEAGTSFDAASILSDETAQALGLTDDATPNDAFAAIVRRMSELVDGDVIHY